MIKYETPVAEEIKFSCTDIILTSPPEETTGSTEESTDPEGPTIPGQGGDVTVPGIGGN